MEASAAPQRILRVRPTLSGCDWCHPPPGFSLRAYSPGDERHWLEIHEAAERSVSVSPALYRQQFGPDPNILRRRQLFIFDESNTAAGTATAWFDGGYLARLTGRERDDFAEANYGRVHWVAVRPEFQRMGLGRALVAAACVRLRELGHERAYLVTWADRSGAIKLYEQLGFVPFASSGS